MKAMRQIKRRTAAFSLVEVALAIGVIGFALMSLIGLLPFGLANFKQAMGNTIEAHIVQNLSNNLFLNDFSVLQKYADGTPPTYFYNNEGTEVPTEKEAIYKATLTLEPLGSANAPLAFRNDTDSSVSAYNVVISITTLTDNTKYAQQHPHRYCLIIANTGP